MYCCLTKIVKMKSGFFLRTCQCQWLWITFSQLTEERMKRWVCAPAAFLEAKISFPSGLVLKFWRILPMASHHYQACCDSSQTFLLMPLFECACYPSIHQQLSCWKNIGLFMTKFSSYCDFIATLVWVFTWLLHFIAQGELQCIVNK